MERSQLIALQKFSCPDGTHYSESLHLHSIVATCLNGTRAGRALTSLVGCKPSACLTSLHVSKTQFVPRSTSLIATAEEQGIYRVGLYYSSLGSL